MSKKVCIVVLGALVCCSVSAVASDVVARSAVEQPQAEFQPIRGIAGHWTLNYATGEITAGSAPTRAEVVYDNTTNDTGFGYAPEFGQIGDPNYAHGDSLWMAGDGLLDSVSFSIYNSDTSAGPLSRVDVQLNFYDPYDAVLGTVTLDDLVIDPALDPGFAGFFTVTDLQALNINLPYACMYVINLTDPQGGADVAGEAIYDPPTVGESPDMFYEGPLDIALGEHAYYFNGDPVANFYFKVGVENPTPLKTLWDTGPTHTVIFNGAETWLGYTSGDYPGCDQRWAAMPFRITDMNAVITEMVLWWWRIVPPDFDDMTADHVDYIIWHRTGLGAPTSFGEVFMEGELGAYVDGGRDYRAKGYAAWLPLHSYAVNIPIPVGDYYLTLYAHEGTGVDGHALAWESGCNYVPEDLEQEFFWRSCNFPDPGFEAYDAGGAVEPGPEMTDPDDRWNLAYMFRGIVCLGDLDGDGVVGLGDLSKLLTNYGTTSGMTYWDGDLDFDGDVDLADLSALLTNYGVNCL